MDSSYKGLSRINSRYSFCEKSVCGKGSSAVVFKGRDLKSEKDVAIKIYNNDKKDGLYLKSARKEIEVLKVDIFRID